MNKDGWDVSKAADSDTQVESRQPVYRYFQPEGSPFVLKGFGWICLESAERVVLGLAMAESRAERGAGAGGRLYSDRLLGRALLRYDGTRRLAWLS